MRTMRYLGTATFVVLSILSAATREVRANAIAVTNVSVINVGGGTADIKSDIGWSNSWNLSWSDDGGATTVTNWDAAWVFLKYKTAGGSWRHAWLTTTGHVASVGSLIEVGSNGGGTNLGVFVRRSATGSGPFSCPNMTLRWDFTKNGLGGTNDVDISVHAMEMVYIPRGAFALGSGGSETGHFFKYPTSSDPYYVTSEGAISCGSSSGLLYVPSRGTFVIPASFPKGFAPFYCMKYEISQGQYATFLNHLDPEEATVRYPAYNGTTRYTIGVVSNMYSATAPDRACNYLSIQDLTSYLDWSGLRPMTELEFEKTCRGTIAPEPNEYPWGTTTLSALTSVSGVDGSGTETALPASANCNSSFSGPVRVGIFAVQGATRQTSGAGYYGVMDLAGNVSEAVIDVSASFTPMHGDGSSVLTALPPGWPGYDGFLRRGGDYSGGSGLNTSHGGSGSGSTRLGGNGGRGVRTAP